MDSGGATCKMCKGFENYDMLLALLCEFDRDGDQHCVAPIIMFADDCSIEMHAVIAFTAVQIASASHKSISHCSWPLLSFEWYLQQV